MCVVASYLSFYAEMSKMEFFFQKHILIVILVGELAAVSVRTSTHMFPDVRAHIHTHTEKTQRDSFRDLINLRQHTTGIPAFHPQNPSQRYVNIIIRNKYQSGKLITLPITFYDYFAG